MEGEVLGIVGFSLVGLAWMFVPFWERKSRPDGKFKPMTIIGVLAILFMTIMTIWGYLE
jgi:hypothetical protein